MGYKTFAESSLLRLSLSAAIVKGLAKCPDKNILCDFTWGEKDYTGRQILAISFALSEKIKNISSHKRIGLVLPPSFYAAVANYACIFAGKVPVNINFTMGSQAVLDCINLGDVDTMISTSSIRAKLEHSNASFPWSDNYFDIVDLIDSLDEKRISQIADNAENISWIFENFGISEFGDSEKEATLIFTSGSESKPKGVILSEKNIIANCHQIYISNVFANRGDVLLGNLPIFHSFGLLFEVWYLAIYAQSTITLFSPLDIKSNIRAIKEKKPTVMIGSPAFYRAYLKRASKEDFASLRMAIAGAEKTPFGFEDLWNNTLGESYREGYGLTETTPVVSVNLPNQDFEYFSNGNRKGSVGKLFPGMQACVVSPDTLQTLPYGEQGLLCLRGPNIFKGYLQDKEATDKVLNGDWLLTGDLSRIDADGFLYIDGRIKRFSKIAGEMVSHLAIESALAKELGVDSSEIPLIAVSSRFDSEKGEAIVLLTSFDITLAKVKDACRKAKVSNLAMPKHIVKIDKIPLLASGKLDLKTIAQIAKQE